MYSLHHTTRIFKLSTFNLMYLVENKKQTSLAISKGRSLIPLEKMYNLCTTQMPYTYLSDGFQETEQNSVIKMDGTCKKAMHPLQKGL